MSWRSSGSRNSNYRRGEGPALLDDSYLVGPPLITLIIGSVALGLILLLLAVVISASVGRSAVRPQPAAQPTAAAAQPTAAAATQPTAAAPAAAVPSEAVGPALAQGTAAETLEVATDTLKQIFAPASLEAPANTLVTLTFNNLSQAVQHNWVLIDGDDTVIAAVNDAAQTQVTRQTGAAGAVPPTDTPGLLVALPLVNLGESYDVTFETPAAGTYAFICTFPGHYLQGMQGELVVK